MIDPQQSRIRTMRACGNRLELPLPDLALGTGLHEIEEAPTHGLQSRNLELVGALRLREPWDLQCVRTVQRCGDILDAEAERAHRGTVNRVIGAREAFRLAVDDEVDGVLPPAY